MADRRGRFEAKLTAGPATARFANGLNTPILAYNGEKSPDRLSRSPRATGSRIAFRNASQIRRVRSIGTAFAGAGRPGRQSDGCSRERDSRTYEFSRLPEGKKRRFYWYPSASGHGLTASKGLSRARRRAFLVKPKVDSDPRRPMATPSSFLTDLRLLGRRRIAAGAEHGRSDERPCRRPSAW